jgi:hypothetical protein
MLAVISLPITHPHPVHAFSHDKLDELGVCEGFLYNGIRLAYHKIYISL